METIELKEIEELYSAYRVQFNENHLIRNTLNEGNVNYPRLIRNTLNEGIMSIHGVLPTGNRI